MARTPACMSSEMTVAGVSRLPCMYPYQRAFLLTLNVHHSLRAIQRKIGDCEEGCGM